MGMLWLLTGGKDSPAHRSSGNGEGQGRVSGGIPRSGAACYDHINCEYLWIQRLRFDYELSVLKYRMPLLICCSLCDINHKRN